MTKSSDNEIINPTDIKSEKNTPHFLTNDNFNRLKKLQNDLFNTLELVPSIRKLVNLLITEENISQLKEQIIRQLNLQSSNKE